MRTISVQDVLRAVGQFNVQLVPEAPVGIISSLDFFGHVAFVPGRMSPVEHGDELLAAARYVGILRAVEGNQGQITLSGVGMAAWLGDEDGKGDVIETPGITLTGATFPAAVRAILPGHGAVTEGTLYSGIPGNISVLFQYQTPRTALDYICTTMDPTGALGASWRVNGDGTLDAGPSSSLFRTTPTCLIVRTGDGYDQTLRALPGQLDTLRDGKEYSSRIVLIASALAGGTADASVVPYNDIHGNPVHITRVIDEQSDTVLANAPARAANALAVYGGIQRTVRLTTDEFDVAGDFRVGDTIWVYDPDVGLVDLSKEVEFRGRVINPAAVSVLSLTWPVEHGYTVGYRSAAGVWTDLTPWVAWESPGGGQIEVADSLVAALTPGVGTIGTQAPATGTGDAAIPGVPVFGMFNTSSYQPGDGLAQAEIQATWSQPLNTDGSTIVDGDHYELDIRPTGTTNWQTYMVAFQQTSLMIQQLSPATSYDFRIRAVDYYNPPNYGAWSSVYTFAASADTIAPATPAPPTVAASLIALQVTHTLGLATGGTYDLPPDMDHLEVYGDTSGSSFVPDPAVNMLGKLAANNAMLTANVPAVGTFEVTSTSPYWVRVIAVDKSGNRSTASSAVTATANLIDDQYVSDLSASKITAGSITAAVFIGGSATFGGALSAATGTFAGALSAATGTFSGNLSGATVTGCTITGGIFQTASSGERIQIDASGAYPTIWLYPSSGSDFAFINSFASGNVGVNSGTGGGADRTRLELTPTLGALQSINASTQATDGGIVQVTSSSAYVGASAGGGITVDSNITMGGGTAYTNTSGNQTYWSTGGTILLQAPSGSINFYPGGNINMNPASGCYITASGGPCNISGSTQVNLASGGASVTVSSGTVTTSATTINLGTSGSSIGLGGATINLSNIPGHAASTSLTMVGRQLYYVSSTRRNKLDIQPAEIPVADVLRLRPVTFIDRGDAERAGGIDGLPRNLGMIAEDVAEIESFGSMLVTVDDGDVPMTLGYERLPVVQQFVLVDHEARLVDLAGRLAALESVA